jgi:WD40 repeat protein
MSLRNVRRWPICLLVCLSLGQASASGPADEPPAPTPQPPLELTVQTGHTAEIHALEYASNGKFFVTAGKDSAIKLWSPEGTLIRTIRTGFWVDNLALSRDNQLLLVAPRVGGTIFLLSLDGRVVHRFPDLPTKEGYVSAVALSDDNRFAAIGTTKGLVLYRLESGADTRLQVESDVGAAGSTLFDGREIGSVLFTHDGNLIGGQADGKLRFWSNEGKLLRTIPASDYGITALALSPDGKTLATAGTPFFYGLPSTKNFQPVTKLWDLEGKLISQFPSHFTRSIRFTPDGTELVSGGDIDDRVNIYRSSGELVRTLRIGKDERTSPHIVALSPDGKTLITADNENEPPGLAIWSVEGEFQRSLLGLSGPMTNAVVSPDGNLIVGLSGDKFVRIWSLTGSLIASLPGHTEFSTGLAYAPNGKYFASGGNEVILWSPVGEKLAELTGFPDGVGALAFTPDSRFLFCGDGKGTVHIYDVQQNKIVRVLKVHDRRVYAIAMDPKGRYFATGSGREEVRIWDTDGKLQGESRTNLPDNRPSGPAYSLAFSPGGDQLVAATANKEMNLLIFDLKCQPAGVLQLPNSFWGGAIAFSKSGRWLAATANRTVVIWDWPTRRVVRVLKGSADTINGLSFTPDERYVVTAGHDAVTRVWRVDNGDSMALLAHGRDWIVYTPDGYFDSSHYGGDLVNVTHGFSTYGIDQFALQLNRPDLIMSRMGIGTPEFIEHLHARYQLRQERSEFHSASVGQSLEAPEVSLLGAKQDGKFAQIEVEIRDQHTSLQSYQVYVNNVPVFHGQGKSITGLTAHVNERIELGQGKNKIEVSAFNSRGVEALRAHWSTIYRSDPKDNKTDLYFIGFGVSRYRNPALNLHFAHKDVLDMAAALQRYARAYGHVFAKTYVDDAVTRDNILKAGELLKNAGVDDTVVVLFSGHGAYDLNKEATYYFGTYDTDGKNLARTAVSYEEIESLLRDIAPRRKLLLLDACESGEMDAATRAELIAKMRDKQVFARTGTPVQQTQAPTKRVFLYERDRYIYNDLARRSGAIVFSSSHAGEMSLESAEVQNGFFTREVLEALGSKDADTNHDGQISVEELEDFVSLKVALITGGLQRPTVDRDNINERFGFPLLQ